MREEKGQSGPGAPNDEVLVPHDLTELSDAALEEVRDLGLPAARLHVLHVLPRLEPHASVPVWPREDDEPRRAHALQALKHRLQAFGYEDARLHVQIGEAASRIVELARSLGVGRIVMPTHSRSGLSAMAVGSVAEHVVRFAPCPVVVLPAALLAQRAPVDAEPPLLDQSPEEQLHALATEILSRVEQDEGHLTGARIAVPRGRDLRWWEQALEEKLAASGIAFVDLVFTSAPVRQARILDLRFDQAST